MNRPIRRFHAVQPALALLTLVVASAVLLGPAASQPAPGEVPMPVYDDGEFLLPADWRQWVFIGASLGLGYSEGGGSEMFHETLMEPTAYRHFERTGEFRDGTMLALLLHPTGEGVLPQRQGRFAADLATIEMAVKDSRAHDTWSYYGFGGRNGLSARAQVIDSGRCNSCHTEHAAHDNVFIQFYPLLAEVAPHGTDFVSNAAVESQPAGADTPPPAARLALDGLDPVLLVDGHAEFGKPKIFMVRDDFTYRFVSEPTRTRFAADPERYAFQNTSCPVIAGAPINPSRFAVHEGRLYAFASQNCVDQFEAEPERFVPGTAGS